jgi:nondiscriminating glutamyl-tRNA synthetase
MEEMQTQFTLERLNPAGAVFDIKKFRWMNSVYLRALDDKTLWQAIYPFLSAAGLELPKESEWQERSVQLFKTSMEVLKDAVELYRPLSDKDFILSEEANEVFAWESTETVLKSWKAEIEAFAGDYLKEENFLSIQDKIKNQNNVKGKHLFMPIRVAVIGKPHGAELKILVPLLKKSSLLARVDKVIGRNK